LLARNRIQRYDFLIAGPKTCEPGALAEEKSMKERFETFCTQLETRVDFFYFFARNPLKSPDSDE
jgi:hypothetical protein